MVAAEVLDNVLRGTAVLLELVGAYSLVRQLRARPELTPVPWWAWGVHAAALGLVGAGNSGVLQTILLMAAVFFALVAAFTLGGDVRANPAVLYMWRRRLPGRLSRLDRAVLTRAMEGEREGFALLVFAGSGGPDLNHLSDSPSPHIDFRFSLHNGSLFPVVLDTQAHGHVACNSQQMSRAPTIECDRDRLEHGWYAQLTLRQWLSLEEAHWLQELRSNHERTQFSFSDVSIELRVDEVNDLSPGGLLLNDGQPLTVQW